MILDMEKNDLLKQFQWEFWESIISLKIPMDYRRILSQFRASVISQRRRLTRMKPNRRYGTNFQCAVDFYERHQEYDYAREWIKKLPLSKATFIPAR